MTSRYLDFKFKKWGDKQYTMQHYHVMYQGKEIATALRTGQSNPNWYVIPVGWSKGINGLRSREAVVQFLRQFYVDEPWFDDPTVTGYAEYSVDNGKTWTREVRPDVKCRMRYVGVSLSIELKGQDSAD